MNTCCFFPSGKVVLSGGADLRLKIWSTEDGSCPVTLKGHTGGLDRTLIIVVYLVISVPVNFFWQGVMQFFRGVAQSIIL